LKESSTWLVRDESHIHNTFASQSQSQSQKGLSPSFYPFKGGDPDPLPLSTFLIRATPLAIIWEKSKTIIAKLQDT
jgi:hypothetical protein